MHLIASSYSVSTWTLPFQYNKSKLERFIENFTFYLSCLQDKLEMDLLRSYVVKINGSYTMVYDIPWNDGVFRACANRWIPGRFSLLPRGLGTRLEPVKMALRYYLVKPNTHRRMPPDPSRYMSWSLLFLEYILLLPPLLENFTQWGPDTVHLGQP